MPAVRQILIRGRVFSVGEGEGWKGRGRGWRCSAWDVSAGASPNWTRRATRRSAEVAAPQAAREHQAITSTDGGGAAWPVGGVPGWGALGGVPLGWGARGLLVGYWGGRGPQGRFARDGSPPRDGSPRDGSRRLYDVLPRGPAKPPSIGAGRPIWRLPPSIDEVG